MHDGTDKEPTWLGYVKLCESIRQLLFFSIFLLEIGTEKICKRERGWDKVKAGKKIEINNGYF